MKEGLVRRISEELWQKLRGEYLGILLLAGRLTTDAMGVRPSAEGVKRPTADATGVRASAEEVRNYTREKLRNCRDWAQLPRIVEAGQGVADYEMVIVHFLDSAATDRFGNWRPIYTELGDEFRHGEQKELGKRMDNRLEEIRNSGARLAEVPDELLEIYDRCLKLGYKAAYVSRLDALRDLQTRIGRELSQRAEVNRPSAWLPSIESRGHRLLGISKRRVAACAALMVLLIGVILQLTLINKANSLSLAVENFVSEVKRSTELTNPECVK